MNICRFKHWNPNFWVFIQHDALCYFVPGVHSLSQGTRLRLTVHFWRPPLSEDAKETLMPLAKGKQPDFVAYVYFPDLKSLFLSSLPSTS